MTPTAGSHWEIENLLTELNIENNNLNVSIWNKH